MSKDIVKCSTCNILLRDENGHNLYDAWLFSEKPYCPHCFSYFATEEIKNCEEIVRLLTNENLWLQAQLEKVINNRVLTKERI